MTLPEVSRAFTSGSRETPDPHDQFLDQHGYYRKHTARDISSLFRVVSEQMYGIQKYHDQVRKECIKFLQQKRNMFEKAIMSQGYCFEKYLIDLSELKLSGSIIELRALSLMHKANVLLFEPFSTGKWLSEPNPNNDKIFRVFISFTKPMHFDSIFTKEFIEKAAFCQTIVYEILYKKVFKLPDVDFAVEHMLYNVLGKPLASDPNGETIGTTDGREIKFDKPDNTECVLEDFRFCNFHNKTNYIKDYQKPIDDRKTEYNVYKTKIRNHSNFNIYLHKLDVSCVRQLLNEGKL